MAKQKEKTPLAKTNWVQSFNIVGEAKVSDFTFKIDEHSEKSDWVYNSLNLQVDCGEKYGKVSCELMGGYGAERSNNVVYVHGKKKNGSDDFKNSYTIAWEDRFDDDILEDIGELCFLTAGLEKDVEDKTVYKKFLTPYDFIAYVQENLTDGMVVNIRGQLRYTVYNGNLQCRKEVNSIALSKAEPKDYKATFTQTMLLDKDSVTKDSIDKDKGVIHIDAYLLEKFKEYNGWDLTDGGSIKGGQFVPLRKSFEYEIDNEKPELTAKIINKLFKVSKNVTQLTLEGFFTESGAAVTVTEDDLDDDIKELIEMGVYTKEEMLIKCAANGAKERRMIVAKPMIKMVGEEGDKHPVIQKFENVYTDEDLMLDCLIAKNVNEDDELPFEEDESIDSKSNDDDDLAALLDALD